MLLDNIIMFSDLSLLHRNLRGQTVVLGTGCFDLLHIGHLYFLSEASKQAEALVVGLNSDNAVRLIKGPSRPIIKQEQRVAVVAALRYVAWVFVYDDVVADDCILTLKPDVFAIGEESIKTYPSEVAAARSVGARLHIVKRMPEASTTSVVADILNKSQA